jgi:hypothetical protein
LSHVRKALSINPRLAEAYAFRGILQMLISETAKDQSQAQHFKEKAQASLKKGISINRNLRKVYSF